MNSFDRLTPVQRVLRECDNLPVHGVRLDQDTLRRCSEARANAGTLFIMYSRDDSGLVIADTTSIGSSDDRISAPELSFAPAGHNMLARTLQRVVVGAFDPHGPFDIAAHCFARGHVAAETVRIAVKSVSDEPVDRNLYYRLNERQKTNKLSTGAGGPTGTWAVAAITAVAATLLHGVESVVTQPCVKDWLIKRQFPAPRAVTLASGAGAFEQDPTGKAAREMRPLADYAENTR